MAPDAAVLADRVRLLAEFEEIVLAREALPRLGENPRRIDAAGGTARPPRPTNNRPIRDREPGAVRLVAIHRAWHPQVSGHRNLFDCVCLEMTNVGVYAWREAVLPASLCSVGGPTCVVDHVRPRVLVTSHIGFNNVPAEKRELLVEGGETVQVGVVTVGEAAVAVSNVRLHQRESGLGGL